ncbi:MAG: hypothetical protein HKN91_16510 [Acidimicrobiia bacterium]|nr:hypothetical protein [Acidimicrobiia bacterium]
MKTNRENGTTILVVAASMLLLIGVAALAIDLGGLRLDRRADRLATDAAATAGAASINPFAGSAADQACATAWAYLLLNLGDEGATTQPPNCATFAPSCSAPNVARQTTAIAPPYTVVITHPVPDSHPLMAGQAINPNFDGTPCQRLGVELTRVRDFAFGGVLGDPDGSTTVRSVAKIGAGVGAGEVVPLLVLEPFSCDALYTSGQGKVTVSYFNDSPGFIVVDSDGSKNSPPNSCNGANSFTIDSQGTQNGWIRAIPVPAPKNIPSAILSYALSGDPAADPAEAYDPADISSPASGIDPSDPPASAFRLYPRPVGVTRRITRAPIDWRYNCKSSYPAYLGVIPIVPCPDTPAAHIDSLIAAYSVSAGDPTAFGYTAWSSVYSCSPSSDITTAPGINWWIDCDPFFVNGIDVDVVIPDGNVIADGDIDLGAGATLTINANNASDSTLFVRAGGSLTKGAQSSITLNRTFVYLADGNVDLVGGVGGLNWSAPTGGVFEDLSLWSESPVQHEIGGQAGNTLTGTFFTPLADPFSLTGQSGQFQTDAQFLTRRLEVKGQGEVLMKPDPDRQTLIPIREVRLIR